MLFTASDFTSITSHTHNWVLFLLFPHLFIFSGIISPLISCILGTSWPEEFIFQCPVFFAFSCYSWGSQGKNTEVVCHSLLQWTTFCQNYLPWPVHLEWPYTAWLRVSWSYVKLLSMWSDWLVFCDCVFILSDLWWMRTRGLWKLPDERDWLRGNLGLGLVEEAMLSKSLDRFSVDCWGRVPSLFFDLQLNYGGDKEDTGDLLQQVLCMHCCNQCPQTCSRPLLTHTSTVDSWTLMGEPGSVSCGVTASVSWVLLCTSFCLCSLRVCVHSL